MFAHDDDAGRRCFRGDRGGVKRGGDRERRMASKASARMKRVGREKGI
jgi:hypothetical protein